MCFGVRDALKATEEVAHHEPTTVLGQLVHNPVVSERLENLGVEIGDLSVEDSSATSRVVITAHGASDRDRERWSSNGFSITDTTCPLVHKAHQSLAQLVANDYFPIVIGKPDHVEVRGLTGDFPEAVVLLDEKGIATIPKREKLGIISQTTQPIEKVKALVNAIEKAYPEAEVRFVDTVCQPTKNRQTALKRLCAESEIIIVVGGHNSNNTSQLVRTTRSYGVTAYHVATPDELNREWFVDVARVGITAGTSTLKETVYEIRDAIEQMGRTLS